MRKLLSVLLVVLLLISATACDPESGTGNDVTFAVSVSPDKVKDIVVKAAMTSKNDEENQNVAYADVTSWKYVAVKGDDGYTTGETTEEKDLGDGDLTLSLGYWTITVNGYSGDTLTYTGTFKTEGAITADSKIAVKVNPEEGVKKEALACFKTLKEAVDGAADGATVTLVADAEVAEDIYITKSVTIDMAGYEIIGQSTDQHQESDGGLYIFRVNKSNVTFELENSSETEAVVKDSGYGWSRGICTDLKLNDVKIVIGKNVKINTSEGVSAFSGELDVYGKIDAAKRACAITGNGSLPYQADDPGVVINLYKGAEVKSTAEGKGKAAIFLPAKGIVNIKGATVEGYAGICIRSGELNITDGAVIKGIEKDAALYDAESGSGSIIDGSAIVVISNSNYYSKMNITITDSTIDSAYSYAIRERKETKSEDTEYTELESLKINGNSILRSGSGDGSNSVASDLLLKNKAKVDITGGTFSKDPSSYLKEGYVATKSEGDNPTWTVTKKAAK